MKKISVLTILLSSLVVFAATTDFDRNPNKHSDKTLSAIVTTTDSFSDGTTVEKITNGSTSSPVIIYQIKERNGKICYAIASAMGDNNAGNGASITCH